MKKERLKRAKNLAIFIIGLIFITPYKIDALTQLPQIAYLDSFTEDEEEGNISFPSFVFAEPVRNEIYVIDSMSRIIIYTSDFFPIFTLSRKDGIEVPQGLTVDGEGNLYVVQSPSKENPRSKISVFNASLKWTRDIYLEGFEEADSFIPHRLAVDKKGNLYVAGYYYPGILILNNKGQLIDIISPEEDGKKVKVNSVTLNKEGRIYIVSEEVSRIYVYDENRKFLFKFGEKGGSTGKLSRPQAVGVDNRTGRIYVVDYMRHTISVYDRDGKYLTEFGGLGWGEGWFQYPKDIAVDSSGRIFIADTFNNRIQVFQAKE
jgi:DNA-binding beta-propeller fold protein YncE